MSSTLQVGDNVLKKDIINHVLRYGFANERLLCSTDLHHYDDAEQTKPLIINQYVRFVDEEPDKQMTLKLNDRLAWVYLYDNR